MPLINFKKYPILWIYPGNTVVNKLRNKLKEIHYKEGELMYWIHELHSRPEIYFYLEFINSNVFSVYNLEQLMTPEELQNLKNGKITLAIGNTAHGYNDTVGEIYKHIIFKYNIKPENVLLRTESADIMQEVNLIHTHLNIPKIKVEWVREFEFGYHTYIDRHTIPNTLENKIYDKKFFSLNGLYRPHRASVIFILESLNLLNKGFVSFNTKNNFTIPEFEGYVNNIIDSYIEYNEIYKLLQENKDRLLNLTRINLDNIEKKFSTAEPDSTHNIYYENSYFSLVTETSFPTKPFFKTYTGYTDTGRILSEKIFKPILNKHPFIVVSNYQTLALLKSLGYKSFSPYIDESYDEIEDDKERLFVIAKEVKRLCELDQNELKEFLVYCKYICEHNFNMLKNQSEFFKKLN